MNFDLSEEQVLLKDSIERYLGNQYDFDHRREVAQSEVGAHPRDWQNFAELGWLSIPFAESAGGYGGGCRSRHLQAAVACGLPVLPGAHRLR